MHLSRRTALLLVVASIACTSNTEPRRINGSYSLQDIDGRSLPTPPALTPGLTPTINASTLTLDPSGNATLTDHQREWNGVEDTLVYNYNYTISGWKITLVGPPCPIGAFCVATISPARISGTIIGDNVAITRGQFDGTPIVYHYHS